MKAACPQCGADVEFRFDDTFVRVCDHCKSAVVRGDRGLETLGQFADLVETGSPLALFATGAWKGKPFELIGRAQLAHAKGGSWDEWYARFDDGRLGWLAEAQGRFYLMFEVVTDDYAPPFDKLDAGERAHVPGTGAMTIAEVGEATYVAAAGEIPFRLAPGTKYRYADLSDEAGAFATIDYGDGTGKPSTYVGESCALAALHIAAGESAAPAAPSIRASRIACPNCDGSIELRAPDQTMHVGCPWCGSLIDVSSGPASVLTKLEASENQEKPEIALGKIATFEGTQLTVIGWMQRSAIVDETPYPFEEYLLYAPSLGFRWLVRSDGSWSYVKPVDAGQVTDDFTYARYGGVRFKCFQRAPLVVVRVLGEMYWRVTIGERVDSADYVAPPAMLSKEGGTDEINWSLGTYLTRDEVERAFGGLELAGWPTTTAPNAPPLLRGMWISLAVVASGLMIGSCIVAASSSATGVVHFTCDSGSTPPPVSDPAAPPLPAGSAVCFSRRFHLDSGENVAFELEGTANNSWISVGGDLVNDDTGDVESFDRDIEYYAGYEDGESWSEGGNHETVYLDPMPEGTYVARIELQSSAASYSVDVTIEQGVFHMRSWLWLALLVLVPGLVLVGIAALREKQRWKDASP